MKAWDEFLTAQEKDLGVTTVRKWLRPLKVLRFDACNLYLEAKDAFQAHWFEEHIRPIVLTKFTSSTNKRIKIHLHVASNTPKQELTPAPIPLKAPPVTFTLLFDAFDPKISFQSFIPSDENKITYSLLKELVDQTLSLGSFNPIYLSGPSGSGKTHLLIALANAFRKLDLNALYARAETFTEHVVSAIRSSEMQKFRATYRNTDILLIDDIEIFSKKGATQEELFHTFNTLHLEGKQIILSSKCAPQELKDIEPRLVSRFEWGIVLPLHPLQEQALKTLLLRTAKQFDLQLTERVSDFLMTTFKSNTKSLLKALDALVLRLHLRQSSGRSLPLPLSLEDTQNLLFDLIKQEEESVLTPARIIHVVAEKYGIRVDDILGKAQSRECSVPRKIAMYFCRTALKVPYMKIGELFGRDHSTVMTSVKQIEEEKSTKMDFAATLAALSKQLY